MQKKPRFALAAALIVIALTLTGCLYPRELRYENRIPLTENVRLVQQAIDDFKQKTGVLPIKTKDGLTPIYQKYAIDFNRLKPYLPYIPGNAFESGGDDMYVLINVETKPTVKLLDVATVQKIADIQHAVNRYRMKTGKFPFGAPLAPGFYRLDNKALGMPETTVRSPYSPAYLPLVIQDDGRVGADYALDLMRLVRDQGVRGDRDRDIRPLLVEHSLYVPAGSFPYHLQKGEPVLAKEWVE